jgi:signal peptidase I
VIATKGDKMKYASLLIASAITLAAAASPVRPVVVIGYSMDPTLSNRQIILASRNVKDLQRGDVVVVDTSEGTSIKRIVYLEGDQVPQYFWKGEWTTPRHSEMKHYFESRGAIRRNVAVPAGFIYLVGDNGLRSYDSRDYGPVPLSCVRLRVNDLPDTRQAVPGSQIAGKVQSVNHT